MKCLLQRVSRAQVEVNDQCVGRIQTGLLVFVGFEKEDAPEMLVKMAEKIVNLRIFPDESGKTNLSVTAINGEILLVSQFTLAANTEKGLRPSFDRSAPAELGRNYYKKLAQLLQDKGLRVELGVFGAHMMVSLTNEGPATYWLSL